jgi:pimeloyl-ACP methyl ester carboxylesterase
MNTPASESDLPVGGAYADVNGLRLYYEVHGAGRPLVLLHGGLMGIELTFGAMVPQLAEHRQVIAIELAGHGRTADTDRIMGLDQLSDDAAVLLGQLGIAQADVFGFSLGGMVALDLVLRRPELVGRLVIASVDHRPGHEEVTDPDAPDMAKRMPTEADFQSMRDFYARVAPDPGHFDDFAVKASAMVHAHEGWSDEQLASIAAPTLVMVGDTDFVPLPHAVAMYELIPNARLAVLPDTTHMGVTRHPERVLPMLLPFLDGTE